MLCEGIKILVKNNALVSLVAEPQGIGNLLDKF